MLVNELCVLTSNCVGYTDQISWTLKWKEGLAEPFCHVLSDVTSLATLCGFEGHCVPDQVRKTT